MLDYDYASAVSVLEVLQRQIEPGRILYHQRRSYTVEITRVSGQ